LTGKKASEIGVKFLIMTQHSVGVDLIQTSKNFSTRWLGMRH